MIARINLNDLGYKRTINLSSFGILFTLAILGGAPARAFNQQSTRSSLIQGQATVYLMATLESLSVHAEPLTQQNLHSSSDAQLEQPILITTSWVVPANLTTFRMEGFLDDRPPGSVNTGELAAAAGTGVLVFTEIAGKTNLPATRTDYLDWEFKFESPSVRTIGSKDTLNILLQAL
jgi:hypothetical protein